MSNDTFRASVELLIRDIKPIVTRLEQRQKIPDNAFITEIEFDDIPEVALLHSLLLPIDVETLKARIGNTTLRPSYSRNLSRLLKLGRNCVGCSLFLSSTSDKSAFLFAIILDPSLRRTWAAAWLKYKTFKHILNCGVEIILFEAFEGNTDTIKHANRVGAERLTKVPAWCA